jgi:cobalt-zinc-cadmium efflux system membrane fusion protein
MIFQPKQKLTSFLVLLSLFLSACTQSKDEFEEYLKKQQPHQKIFQTFEIKEAKSIELVTLPAILSFPPEKQQWLSLPMSGQILNWSIKPGDSIKKGDKIADLKISEMTDLNSILKQNQEQLNQQKNFVELMKRQRQNGIADEKQLQEAQLELSRIQNQVNALQIQQKGRNQLGILGDGHQWSWRSPSAGKVSEISCPVGSMIDDQDRCVRLIDDKSLWIEAQLPQTMIEQLSHIYQATFWPKANQDHPIALIFERSSVEINQGQGSVTIYFKPKEEDISHLPTMLANLGGKLRIELQAKPNTYEVPRQAITLIDGIPSVFIVDAKAVKQESMKQESIDDLPPIKLIRVELLGEIDDKSVIKSEDLKLNDLVYSQGVFSIKTHFLLHREDTP